MQNADVYLNFIGGQWKQGSAAEWDENRCPARPGEILGRATRSTAADAARAVDAAQAAYERWSSRPRSARALVLEKVALLMKARAEQFAKTITMEEGKNLSEARAEVQKTVTVLEHAAAEGHRAVGDVLTAQRVGAMVYTKRVPLGVVGVITPWNFPLLAPSTQIAPALLEGNTVVFKPSSLTPASAKLLVFTFEEAGLPAGVLNLVFGAGQVVGVSIVGETRVKAIAFNGTTEVGREVSTLAARRLARVQLEPNGRNPVVVCPDADLDQAVEATALGAFAGSGQRAMATSRVLVERSIHPAFVRRLVERVRQLKIGDGLADPNAMGPIVDEKKYRAVLKAIESARAEGGVLACGGEPATAPGGGRYVTPTVFDEVRPEMKVVREEICGPLLAVIPVEDFEQALDVANILSCGLSSTIFTGDLRRITSAVDRFECNAVQVNPSGLGRELNVPEYGFFCNRKIVEMSG